MCALESVCVHASTKLSRSGRERKRKQQRYTMRVVHIMSSLTQTWGGRGARKGREGGREGEREEEIVQRAFRDRSASPASVLKSLSSSLYSKQGAVAVVPRSSPAQH